MTLPPFPLAWPEGLPRTSKKAVSQFRTSLSAALDNVRKSLAAFGADTGKPVKDVVITSNVAGISFDPPSDTGVAVWFEWDGGLRCIAVDRYPKVQCNLQAIHHILEARRTEMRHGGLHIVRQTFKGFAALPAPPGKRDWRDVLGLHTIDGCGPEAHARVIAAFKEKAKTAHPDRGGSNEAMSELVRARDEALAALK